MRRIELLVPGSLFVTDVMLEKQAIVRYMLPMGRRGQPRLKGILPVRIWGVDGRGRSFIEYVCTSDISGRGASLVGVCAHLWVGATIGLQYRNNQARFRVVRVSTSATVRPHVAVECLEPDKVLWPVTLPGEQPDSYRDRESTISTRRHMRFPVTGRVQVSRINGGVGVRADLRDISLAGCYLQISEPPEIGRKVSLLMKTAQAEIETIGVVRFRYPGLGMGIEFTFMSKADRRALQRLISHLEKLDERVVSELV